MGASKSKADDESSSHEVWSVLPHHMGGGPHGLGTWLSSVTTEVTPCIITCGRVWVWHVLSDWVKGFS